MHEPYQIQRLPEGDGSFPCGICQIGGKSGQFPPIIRVVCSGSGFQCGFAVAAYKGGEPFQYRFLCREKFHPVRLFPVHKEGFVDPCHGAADTFTEEPVIPGGKVVGVCPEAKLSVGAADGTGSVQLQLVAAGNKVPVTGSGNPVAFVYIHGEGFKPCLLCQCSCHQGRLSVVFPVGSVPDQLGMAVVSGRAVGLGFFQQRKMFHMEYLLYGESDFLFGTSIAGFGGFVYIKFGEIWTNLRFLCGEPL